MTSLRCRFPRLLASVLSLLLFSSLIHSQPAANPKFAAIKERMQKFVDDGDIAGAVTIVGKGDGILYCEAVGYQTLETKTPMEKDSLFRIASMTKPITALGIMILVDEGKLLVDDPVEKYLPEFKGQMLLASRTADAITLKKPSRPITLHDLLTHTSGLPSYPPGVSATFAKRGRTLEQSALVLSQQPLQFEPGSKWAYSNSGMDTLGRIIEVVSGVPYAEFLKKRIFEPLGMKHTSFFLSSDQLPHLATTYNKKDGKMLAEKYFPEDYTNPSRFPSPAGGLFTIGDDLSKLYRTMLGRGKLGDVRIISEKSFEAMTKTQTGDIKTGFTDGMSYGLGFAVVKEPTGITGMLSAGTFGHGGAWGTQAWIDPKQNAFFLLLIQRSGLSNSDASPMRHEFQGLAVEALK